VPRKVPRGALRKVSRKVPRKTLRKMLRRELRAVSRRPLGVPRGFSFDFATQAQGVISILSQFSPRSDWPGA
jgi:hypothetical protein